MTQKTQRTNFNGQSGLEYALDRLKEASIQGSAPFNFWFRPNTEALVVLTQPVIYKGLTLALYEYKGYLFESAGDGERLVRVGKLP